MDASAEIQTLVQSLNATLQAAPDVRKQGEEYLKGVSSRPGFLILLLNMQGMANIPPEIRLAAALYFKNFVKMHWAGVKEDSIQVAEEEREQIKGVLVELMLSVDSRIQKVIAEAISCISENEFPSAWPNLLPQLVAKFNTQDWNVINGVLKTIHSILRRYRHTFSSESILGELKEILRHLQQPYHALFTMTVQAIEANANNQEALKTLFVTANLLFKVFFSLNAVDLPEFFEDNMSTFMPVFSKFLNFTTAFPSLTEGEKEDSPGLLHKIQANVCSNLNLYIEKYEEEFQPYLNGFVKDVWTKLVSLDNSPKFDRLANVMIHFLTSVAKSIHHTLFADDNILKQICGFIVIPNMKIRESDEETYEDHPAEYIRRDSEGSDTDTRRRAALELVKGLRKHYEAKVTQLFSADITQMLSSGNWVAKDTAIYLVTALAVRSATAASGTTATNELVPIVDFCRSQILPELDPAKTKTPILKATCIKFITTFRQQLPPDVYQTVMPVLVALLRDPDFVIHSYAATSVERLLTVRDQGRLRVGALNTVTGPMLTNLFETLSAKKDQENEYLMKAVMRIISSSGNDITPFTPQCMQKLVETLSRIAANPTNPVFNHYVFEALGALIKNSCAQNNALVQQIEPMLFPAFQQILSLDIVEFAPYVFQILSLLLELSPVPISPAYAQILPPLLMVVMWERKSNIPALIRLVQAYFRKGSNIVISGNHLISILGIFQKKLNKSKMHDHEGFLILEAIVENLAFADFERFLSEIFKEIFGRVSTEKTLKYVKSFIIFMSVFIGKHDPSKVVRSIDALQPNLFAMVLDSLYLPNVAKVNGKLERKICAVAMTRLITESPEMLTTYANFWPRVSGALLSVLELPEDETENRGEFLQYDDEETENTFTNAAYTPLSYAQKQDNDPFPGVEPKKFLATQLFQRRNPQIVGAVRSLSPAEQAAISSYNQLAGIPEPS